MAVTMLLTVKTSILVSGIAALSLLPGHVLSAAQGSLPGGARFLDLPDGFGLSEEDEDTPELIEFYSQKYEGDAFFFVLDGSISMRRPAASGERKFDVLKREVTKAISALTKRSVVTCVFYSDDEPIICGEPPQIMDAPGKARIIATINGIPLKRWSCMALGTDRAFQIAATTRNDHRTMIIVADGRTQCQADTNEPERVFQRIMTRNSTRMPINTLYIGPQNGKDWDLGKPLLERIARATNGRFSMAQ